MQEPPSADQRFHSVSRAALFTGFLTIGLLGFGGVAPWARHVIVERRRWLSEGDYANILALGQVLPGANTVNAAVMIGDRFQGLPGAALAVLGLMAAPLLILVGLAEMYVAFAAAPPVRTGLAGAAAAAAGLVIGMACKMARRLRPDADALLIGGLTFAAIGLIRLPLLPVVGVLGPMGIALAALRARRAA